MCVNILAHLNLTINKSCWVISLIFFNWFSDQNQFPCSEYDTERKEEILISLPVNFPNLLYIDFSNRTFKFECSDKN